MEESRERGSCSVCGKEATLKCSNCRQEFYCNKNHQREHWQCHKSDCQAWEICENAELGRHLIATRDLNPGDTILSESPLVWGPAPHIEQRICVGCGKQCDSIVTKCPKCLWPACIFNCEGLSDKNKHELECALLSKSRTVPRCEVLLAIRMLILWRTKSKRWDSLAKLQSHENSRGPGTEAYEEVMNVTQHLTPLLMMEPSCKNILPKICGLIDVNALDTIPPEGSAAIYETASLLEHNCVANTRHTFSIDDKGRPRITVKAIKPIKKGDHLSTMYTHALWSTRARQEHLLATKYFNCRCERCADPTELGTHISTIKCPCKDGYILPNDPLDSNADWFCNSCPAIYTSMEVSQLMMKLEEEVDAVMRYATKAALSELLSRLQTLLHPNHQHCISVGHSLIQLLDPDDPQKRELCKRIIDVVNTVDPHGTRLALYAAVALRELAGCPEENPKDLLTQAVTLLKSEPTNSAGEKLLKLMECELSCY